MEIDGERRIPAPRHKVWTALRDPQVLRACIPGCQTLERTGDNAFKASLGVSVGPLATRLTGTVTLTELEEPSRFAPAAEGRAGTAGSAKGSGTVTLADEGPFTLLRYRGAGQASGKLAQQGAAVLDPAARGLLEGFLDRFTAEVASPAEVAADGPVGMVAAVANSSAHAHNAPAPVSLLAMIPANPYGYPLAFWIGGLVFLAVFVLVAGGSVVSTLTSQL